MKNSRVINNCKNDIGEKIINVGIDLSSFSSEHAGGKDEVAYNLLRGLSELGHTSSIICICRAELNRIVRDIDPNYRIVNIDRYFTRSKRASEVFNWFHTQAYGYRLRKVLKDNHVDVLLFTNKFSPHMSFPMKTVEIPHDMQHFFEGKIEGIPRTKWTPLNHLFCKRDVYFRDMIIAISEFDKNTIITNIPGSDAKVVKIYDPIRFADKVPAQNEKKYITAVNIQWVQKNTKTLIEAFKRISDKTSYDLMLVGRMDFRSEIGMKLLEAVEESGVKTRIHFAGFVSFSELERIISETAVYVNPSFFEGFGMTAVEMMANCVPTIVAKSTAMPETTMGLCDYYYPEKDSEELAQKILYVLNNPKPFSELEEISRRIKERYSYLHISEQYWKMLIG